MVETRRVGWLLAGIMVTACAPDAPRPGASSNDIRGSVREWAVHVDHLQAVEGVVTFTVANEGTIDHEFLVVRTDLPAGEIPVSDGRFSEDDVEVIDEIPEYEPGETKTLSLDLQAGS